MALTPARSKEISLNRNPNINMLESGYIPGTIAHGEPYTITSPSIVASGVTESSYLGGYGTAVEDAEVGDEIAPPTGWNFTDAAHAPIVALDPERDKVMLNDYFGQLDVNATKEFELESQLAPGEKLYFSRMVKAVVKTTSGADFPMDNKLQWKTWRVNSSGGVSDSGNNTYASVYNARWFRQPEPIGGNGPSYVVETGDGILTGNAANGGTLSKMKVPVKTWGTNTLAGRGLQINSGSSAGDYVRIISNTQDEITPIRNFTAIPDSTSNYSIDNAIYYSEGGLLINHTWQRQEVFIKNNSLNANDGYICERIWRDGQCVSVLAQRMTTQAGTPSYKHILIGQDYFGNNDNNPITHKEIISDDVVILRGSFNRDLLMDKPTLDPDTAFEIQTGTVTINGQSTGVLNIGGYPPGDGYLANVDTEAEFDGDNVILTDIVNYFQQTAVRK